MVKSGASGHIKSGSSSHVFTTAVAMVCTIVEFFTAAFAIAVFGCLTTAVEVVGCDEHEIKAAYN